MSAPDLDEHGRMIDPPLKEFHRYIAQGISCVLKLVISNPGDNVQSFQFSMTPDQCREMARNLTVCAQVIEAERPTSPQ